MEDTCRVVLEVEIVEENVTEKKFLWLGVDHNRKYDTRNQSILKHARYIKQTNH